MSNDKKYLEELQEWEDKQMLAAEEMQEWEDKQMLAAEEMQEWEDKQMLAAEEMQEWEDKQMRVAEVIKKWTADQGRAAEIIKKWIDVQERSSEARIFNSSDILLIYISKLPTGRWFRGHADAKWPLKPSIARIKNPSLSYEKKFRQKFENQTTFLDPASYPQDIVKLTFSMQHHGLPTRLLDWSTSPLTALYFAVNDHDDCDGCLWELKPSSLNRQYGKAFPFSKKIRKNLIKKGEKVLAIHAPYTNLRMKSQMSEFTMHAHYEAMENDQKIRESLKKISISHTIKEEIRKRLSNLGITRAALFPDLDNIAKTIKESILETPDDS